MEGRVVVLLRTSSVARAPVYAHLRTLGLQLLVVHPIEPVAAFDGLFDWWLPHDTDDVGVLEPILRRFVEAHALTDRVAAVVSFDEYAVYPAALLATRWKLQAVPLPPEALRHVNIKSDFRAWCHKHGVCAPRCVVLRPPAVTALPGTAPPADDDDTPQARRLSAILSQIDGLSFPLVLKPSPGAGSLLTRVCANVEEVADHTEVMWRTLRGHPDERHFAALRRSYSDQDWPSSLSPSTRMSYTESTALLSDDAAEASPAPTSQSAPAVEILAEEYVNGHEVDMDCAVERGHILFCAISDNFETKLPFCAEEGGLCPSSLPEHAQIALRDLLVSFVEAHGSRLHGVLHFEAKYDPVRRAAYVIEVNCRMGSAETHHMLCTAYRGLQLGEALVRCAMQLPLAPWLARYYPECWTPVTPLVPSSNSFHAPSSWDAKQHSAPTTLLSAPSRVSEKVAASRNTAQTAHTYLSDHSAITSCAQATNGLSASMSTSASYASVLSLRGDADSDCGAASTAVVLAAHLTNATCDPTLCSAPIKGVLPCVALGGPAYGYYPACAVAASVNIYPTHSGVLRRAAVPEADPRLVAWSVSASPGDRVEPPPGRLYLLCWMVARGLSTVEAVQSIKALTAAFEQRIETV